MIFSLEKAVKILKNKYIYKWEIQIPENAEAVVGAVKAYSFGVAMSIVGAQQMRAGIVLKAEL